MRAYAELHCISAFTFLRGASDPEELIKRAAEFGYFALALTDECSVAGIVRAHVAARDLDIRLIVGSEFRLVDGLQLVLLAINRRGYGQLCELITRGRRAAKKGEYHLVRSDFAANLDDCLAIWIPGSSADEDLCAANAGWLSACFPAKSWMAVELLADGEDRGRLASLTRVSATTGLPMVATGDVHMHVRGRRALQDIVTAIRLKTQVDQCGYRLHPNGERHLRDRRTLGEIYPATLLQASVDIAERIDFSLDELRYEYPLELVPSGYTPATYLRYLTEIGIRQRWPEGIAANVRQIIDHELELITELRYEPYFLTVHDIVRFARGRGILCQGRGSAANSAVFFCVRITEVDPARMSNLVEHFIYKKSK